MSRTYYGEESRRARDNFPLDHRRTDLKLIYAIVEVKKAAAHTYMELGVSPDLYQAVAGACDRVLAGRRTISSLRRLCRAAPAHPPT